MKFSDLGLKPRNPQGRRGPPATRRRLRSRPRPTRVVLEPSGRPGDTRRPAPAKTAGFNPADDTSIWPRPAPGPGSPPLADPRADPRTGQPAWPSQISTRYTKYENLELCAPDRRTSGSTSRSSGGPRRGRADRDRPGRMIDLFEPRQGAAGRRQDPGDRRSRTGCSTWASSRIIEADRRPCCLRKRPTLVSSPRTMPKENRAARRRFPGQFRRRIAQCRAPATTAEGVGAEADPRGQEAT